LPVLSYAVGRLPALILRRHAIRRIFHALPAAPSAARVRAAMPNDLRDTFAAPIARYAERHARENVIGERFSFASIFSLSSI